MEADLLVESANATREVSGMAEAARVSIDGSLVAEAECPIDALRMLCEAGMERGVDVWLLACDRDIWHGYLYSYLPLRGTVVQQHMAGLADYYRHLVPDALCLRPASRIYPVQTAYSCPEPTADAWNVFRTHEIRAGRRLQALLRVGSLANGADVDWGWAVSTIAAVGPTLVHLATTHPSQCLGLLDPTTGLYNAAYFHEQLQREALRAASYGAELALVVIDVEPVDNGHDLGTALREIGQMIAANSRRTDTCARLGPARLAILMPHTTKRNALLAAMRLDQMISSQETLASKYKVRFGVSGWNLDGPDEGELLRQAEEAAHRAAMQDHQGPFLYC